MIALFIHGNRITGELVHPDYCKVRLEFLSTKMCSSIIYQNSYRKSSWQAVSLPNNKDSSKHGENVATEYLVQASLAADRVHGNKLIL